jgi:uncharacterized membrane protein SpoIIM required for sporulation
MKETAFIQQNQEKWRRFEQISKEKTTDPDELSRLFVEITEDLSYARTFYPRRSVRVYLNYLAQNVFNRLYKKRRESYSRFLDFWTRSLPLEMYRARKPLMYAFLIFTISGLIGVISTAYDINFARTILSDGYVDLTNEYIESGDAMHIYKTSEPFNMFVMIFTNNIRVAFFCFILGIFAGVGTSFFLIFNGIMLGAFQSYFYYKGMSMGAGMGDELLYSTFLTIWIHGAFEISAIILAGAAGITLGNGLLFPHSYTRMQSLQIAARRGLKMMIGITPFFLIAAILESWVTRQTGMPEIIKLIIIFGSFAIVLLYFVIYPFIIARRYPGEVETREEPKNPATSFAEKFKIRQTNEIFIDSFNWYKVTFKSFAGPLFAFLIPLQIAFLWWYSDYNYYAFNREYNWFDLSAIFFGLNNPGSPIAFFFHVGYWSLFATTIYHAIHFAGQKEEKKFLRSYLSFLLKNTWKIVPVILVIYAAISFPHNGLVFLLSFAFPILFFLLYPLSSVKKGVSYIAAGSFQLAARSWSSGLLIIPVYVLITGCFFLLFSSFGLTGNIITQFIEWHYIMETTNFILTHNFVDLIITILFFNLALPLTFLGFVLHFYSQAEKESAHSLFERLKKFGTKSKTMETESDYED